MVEFGLFNVANSPNLTFIFFIGLSLLGVLGLRFGFYALLNRTRTEIESQSPIWSYLSYIGVLAAVYALGGLLEIISSLDLPYKSGAILGMTLMLAFAIRQIHFTATSADAGAARASSTERLARSVFIAVVFADVLLVAVEGQSVLTAALEGLGALAFVGYGAVYYRDGASNSRLQGTMLDSMLRHLLPVLTFASLVSIINLAIPFGLERIVVLHVQVVFIIMTATALMTGTIKLRQNLASL